MAKSPKQTMQKLLELSLSEMGERTFTKALNTHTARLISMDNEFGYVYSYTVPKTLCKTVEIGINKTIDILPPSAALAIMDDLSAYAVIGEDKSGRPGVSVKLTTEIFRPCYPNTEVLCKFKVDKIGKSMGFCTMEILEKDSNKLIARGQHIKYMPMGFLWEFLFHPKTTSRLYNLYDNNKDFFHKSFIGKIILNSIISLSGRRNVPNILLDSEVGAVFRALQLVSESKNNQIENSFILNSKYGINMIIGQIHGGATAMAVEEACSKTIQKTVSEKLFLQSMEVTYLSPLKGKLRITCKDDLLLHNSNNELLLNLNKYKIIGNISSVHNDSSTINAQFSTNFVETSKFL